VQDDAVAFPLECHRFLYEGARLLLSFVFPQFSGGPLQMGPFSSSVWIAAETAIRGRHGMPVEGARNRQSLRVCNCKNVPNSDSIGLIHPSKPGIIFASMRCFHGSFTKNERGFASHSAPRNHLHAKKYEVLR
jgi:hypothetical protein